MMIHKAAVVLVACAVSVQAGWFSGNGVSVQTVRCDNASSIIFTNPAGTLGSFVASTISNQATLSAVLAIGNNAAGQSATNFADISGRGSVAWGMNMPLGNITGTTYGASQVGYNKDTGTVIIAKGSHGAHQAVYTEGSGASVQISEYSGMGSAGALQRLYVYNGTASVGAVSDGAHQYGRIWENGAMSMGLGSIASEQAGYAGNGGGMLIEGAYGASQRGIVGGSGASMSIGSGGSGALQLGEVTGTMEMLGGSIGSMQHGYIRTSGAMSMGLLSYGSHQHGHVDQYSKMQMGDGACGAIQAGSLGRISTSGSQATNGGNGALQLFDLTGTQVATTTADGDASILLGAGTSSNKNAIVAGDGQVSNGDGSITAGGGFYGPTITVQTQYLYWASATNCAGIWMDQDNQYVFRIKMGVYSAITNAIP